MYPGPSASSGRVPGGLDGPGGPGGQDGALAADARAEQFIFRPPRWGAVNHYSMEARLQRTNEALRRVLDRLEGLSGPMPTPTQKVALEAQMRELAAQVEELLERLRGHHGRHVA